MPSRPPPLPPYRAKHRPSICWHRSGCRTHLAAAGRRWGRAERVVFRVCTVGREGPGRGGVTVGECDRAGTWENNTGEGGLTAMGRHRGRAGRGRLGVARQVCGGG